jgi:hypothetical protein
MEPTMPITPVIPVPAATICPQCHIAVRPSDFFCFNCGKNLKPKLLPTGIGTEIMYYAGSILLPPLGYWWAAKYLRQPDAASKRIGVVSIVLTTVSLIVSTVLLVGYINKLNSTVGSQLNGLDGF